MGTFSKLKNALQGEQAQLQSWSFESDENGELSAADVLEATGEALTAVAEVISDNKDDIAAVETEEATAETATASLESIYSAESIAENLVETKGTTEEEALAIVAPVIEDAEVNVDAEPGTFTDGTTLEDATSEAGAAKGWWVKVKETAKRLYQAILDALKSAKAYLMKLYDRYFDGATKLKNAAASIKAAAEAAGKDREGNIKSSAKQSFNGKYGASAIGAGVSQTTNFVSAVATQQANLAKIDGKIKDIVDGKELTKEEIKAVTPDSGVFSGGKGHLIGAAWDATSSSFKAATGEGKEVAPATLAQIKEIAGKVADGAGMVSDNAKKAKSFVDELTKKVDARSKELAQIKEGEKAEEAKKKIKALTELRRFSSSAIKSVGSTSTNAVLASYQNALTFLRDSLPVGGKKKEAEAA